MMVQTDWLRYELRRVGLAGLLTPLVIMLTFSGFGLLMRANGVSPDRSTRAVVAGLEIGVATATGLIAATLVASDSLLELQLSLPSRYRTTFARRLALMLGWSALVGIGTTLVVRLIGHELAPVSLLAQQLVWLAPLACFTGLGALLTLVLRSRGGAAAAIAGIWITETLFGKVFGATGWLQPVFLFATSYSAGKPYWLSNRLDLIALGLIFGALALTWLKRNPSILLGGEG
jgi:hypothetical protein